MSSIEESVNRAAREETNRRFPVRTTMLVALAVFAVEATWNFYDAQVPPLVQEYVSSAAVIGLVMGIDNVVGIFLAPWVGHRSDRTRTRLGRRLPYLLALTPIAAVAFTLLPFATTMPVLIVLIVVYALTTNVLKPVAETLLPDFLERQHLARGTAVVKIATSLTIVVSALISIFLIDDQPKIAFAIPAVMMVAAVAVLAVSLRETRSIGYRAALAADDGRDHQADSQASFRWMLGHLFRRDEFGSMKFLLATIVFLAAWTGSRSLLTPYGTEALDLSRGVAGGLPLLAGVGFLVAAYPAAVMGQRFGRMSVARGGIALFVASMVIASLTPSQWPTAVALLFGAIGYAGFVINGVVIWWGYAPDAGELGTYTGVWTAAFALAQTVGPFLLGSMIDLTGWRWTLADTGVLALIALLLLTGVRENTTAHTKEK